MSDSRTIYALSSGRPPAGIAVVRVSGPEAGAALDTLSGGRRPTPRHAKLVSLRSAAGTPVDTALVLWFPAPSSFTGEDMAEFHVTGGVAVVAALLRALGEVGGLRLALPGEFARRAFDNGKLDLTAAEGLADLVDAQSEAQRLQALRQASGGLKTPAEGWTERLLVILGDTEATLDFGEDEADVIERIIADQTAPIAALRTDIDCHITNYAFAERLRRGVVIVVSGKPNVGKSSLVNALTNRDVAIVSTEPGTTRDLIEVHLDLAGIPAVLIDTAGLRVAGGGVEAEGIRRARQRTAEADIVLHLVAPGETPADGAIGVATKADTRKTRTGGLEVSALTGEGLDALKSALVGRAVQLTGSGEDLLVTRERQRDALAACSASLGDAICEHDTVLRAEALRRASRALGELTGRVTVDAVLDHIFSRYCIGK